MCVLCVVNIYIDFIVLSLQSSRQKSVTHKIKLKGTMGGKFFSLWQIDCDGSKLILSSRCWLQKRRRLVTWCSFVWYICKIKQDYVEIVSLWCAMCGKADGKENRKKNSSSCTSCQYYTKIEQIFSFALCPLWRKMSFLFTMTETDGNLMMLMFNWWGNTTWKMETWHRVCLPRSSCTAPLKVGRDCSEIE